MFLFNTGDEDVDGNGVPGRRVYSPMHCENYENATDHYKILFDRSILWAMGQLEEEEEEDTGINNQYAKAYYIRTISAGCLTFDLTNVGNNANINIFDISGRLLLNTITHGGRVN